MHSANRCFRIGGICPAVKSAILGILLLCLFSTGGAQTPVDPPQAAIPPLRVSQADTAALSAGAFCPTAEIHIEKYTNGANADEAPGPILTPGSPITWQYVVTNPGSVPLALLSVTDNHAGVEPAYLKGDANHNKMLDQGESWIYEAYGTAEAGQYENIGKAAGCYQGSWVEDSDPSHYFGKWNQAKLGDFVWQDLNRNGIQEEGEPGLQNVKVEVYTSDGTAIERTLSNSDGQYLFTGLAPGTYYVVFTAPSGYAFSPQDQGSDDAVDSDPDRSTGRTAVMTLSPGEKALTWDAGFYKLTPALHLEKLTNGDDADVPVGPSIAVGSAVNWSYEITNPGDVALSDISVTDSDEALHPVYISGDADGDALLDPGEEWIYEATGRAEAGQYRNTGTVKGFYDGLCLTDSDPSHYFGGKAGIEIKKYTNDEDADAPPGPFITPGAAVTWSYIIKNTGNVAISAVLVTDSEEEVKPSYVSGDDGNGLLDVGESWRYEATGTARAGQYANTGTVHGTDVYNQTLRDSDPAHYFGPNPGINIEKLVNSEDADVPAGPAIPTGSPVQWSYIVTNRGNVALSDVVVMDDQGVTPQAVDTTPADGYIDGDVNRDNMLDTGETWSYTAAGVAIAGSYVNWGTATGRFNEQKVSGSDPAYYWGGFATIQIEKMTNGEDADNAPGPSVLVGDPVTWSYVVKNLGNSAIRDVVVSDSDGLSVTPIEGTQAGDLDGDGLLDPEEIWHYQAAGIAAAGQYRNVGTVTGIDVLSKQPVSDADPSHYFGARPYIKIQKYTNGEDADDAPGPILIPGASVTWQYVLDNKGNVALSDIVVADDHAEVEPIYLSGDVDEDGMLDVEESWIYEAHGTAVAGQYRNLGTVTSKYQDLIVEDEDASHYYAGEDLDFGDAPDPEYPTLLANDGARHRLTSLFLGKYIDAESDGLAAISLLGDDLDGTDDEDGVLFPTLPLVQNTTSMVEVVSTGQGYLNAWIDFNRDGDWSDPGEQIIQDFPVISGNNSIAFAVPMVDANAEPATHGVNARFRLSSQKGLGVTGLALDGEVEDYPVTLYVPVELTSFTAQVENGAVRLSWTTQSESDNLGFILFRSENEFSDFQRISGPIIPGAGTTSSKHTYAFVDRDVASNKAYYYKLADVSLSGVMHTQPPIKVKVEKPTGYVLEQNYPNPFNPETMISFSMEEAGEVTMTVCNLKGQIVRHLVAGRLNAGFHYVRWDARDDAGNAVPSGAYLCMFKTNGFNKIIQMSFLK